MSIVCAGQEVELVSQGSPSAGAQPSQAPAPAAGQQGQQAEDEEPPPPEPIGRSACKVHCVLTSAYLTPPSKEEAWCCNTASKVKHE